jgi:hypothetical protein
MLKFTMNCPAGKIFNAEFNFIAVFSYKNLHNTNLYFILQFDWYMVNITWSGAHIQTFETHIFSVILHKHCSFTKNNLC